MALDERAFFSDKNETRPARYACPRCQRTNEYNVRWVRRVKKDRLPPGADERDRAKFAKLRDHLIRLPKDVEDEEATTPRESPASEPSADKRGTDRRGPRRVTSPPRGWRG